MSAPSEPAAARRVPERAFAPSATLVAGLLIVGFWAACAVLGDRLVPLDPYADDLMSALASPSAEHWFGTDRLGRDVFSRVIVGARDILAVAPLATLLGAVLGMLLGLVTGYFQGLVDGVVSRVLDALLALPSVIVALMALAALGASNVTVVVVIGLLYAPLIARTVRAAVRAEREKEYIAAAQLAGENPLTIMLAEILPNVLKPIVVEVTLRLGYAIFQVATLSFLGFGIQPPSADWGLSIAENYALIGGGYWWTVLFDGLATISLVVGVNLVADGVERALDA